LDTPVSCLLPVKERPTFLSPDRKVLFRYLPDLPARASRTVLF
jgi:hypothetical protein